MAKLYIWMRGRNRGAIVLKMAIRFSKLTGLSFEC